MDNDLSSSATKGDTQLVTFNDTDARVSPVVFDNKDPLPETTRTARDFYKPHSGGGHGLTDEEFAAQYPEKAEESPRPAKPKAK